MKQRVVGQTESEDRQASKSYCAEVALTLF